MQSRKKFGCGGTMSHEQREVRLGIIGGSGLYRMAGLQIIEQRRVVTAWGAPSDDIVIGRLAGRDIIFLPRHGRHHQLLPGEINYRANIAALKSLGVTDILSLSACGSFRETLAPGSFVIIDQFIDRTFGRPRSFFGEGVVAHVSMAAPLCNRLAQAAATAAEHLGITYRQGGTYLCIEGPQFSTRAESQLYRSWGADVVGMTNLPEAYLAREAEICYQTVATVTDYDSWHEAHAAVEVSDILRVVANNSRSAQELVAQMLFRLAEHRGDCPQGCDRALDQAIVTPVSAWPQEATEHLATIAGPVMGGSGERA